MAAESIERDVAVQVVSYEPRIDCSASARNSLVEGIMRVRREVAYTYWRGWLPQPEARRARHDRRRRQALQHRRPRISDGPSAGRQLLIDAINLWPARWIAPRRRSTPPRSPRPMRG
jgi:hypothetical protein